MAGSDTRAALLDAAERLFEAGGEDPFPSLSFRRIAKEAGFSEATMRKHFPNRGEFVEEFTAYLLRSSQEDSRHAADPYRPAQCGENGGKNVYERLIFLISNSLELIGQESSFRPRLSLSLLAEGDESAKKHLAEIYESLDRSGESLFNGFIADYADVARRRTDWLTAREFAVAVNALLEGLSLRHRVSPDSIPDYLAGRITAAILVSLVSVSDDVGSVAEILNELQRRTELEPSTI